MEDTIRARDERITKLQEAAEKQTDEFLAKLKRVTDGQKDLKWENEAMADLLTEKEEEMKVFVARLKQLEWEHITIVESMRDPNNANENWIAWKDDEEQEYYGGLDAQGNF
jgi:septal ring factor EnvC (AmiA/AmiB activator)